jgi:molybdenum cofactor biosynthesis enzyme MoaA
MSLRYCSKNPDLLLPDVMQERLERISDFWGWRLGQLQHFDRITAFVTHRCNLRCRYCNGPHMNLKSGPVDQKRNLLRTRLGRKSFHTLLTKLTSQVKVRHIHFTGGEPTLNKDLAHMVNMATEHGILTSLTTNGTALFAAYKKLIANGLTEIRISLDSYQPEHFDQIVRVPGTFKRVIENIQKITKLRDQQGADIFLVINACVDTLNLQQLNETLDFLLGLKPNDIKFLVVAQDKNKIQQPGNDLVVRQLAAKLEAYPESSFPLLRKKISLLFEQDATGLTDPVCRQVMRNCFIPLTERTIDGKHFYPCSIYLRYLGKPLGHISESFEKQQKKIMEFVRQHDCRTDPICSQHCTNCCKTFNVEANKKVDSADLPIIELPKAIAADSVEDFLSSLSQILSARKPIQTLPFIVIKPYGQVWRQQILDYLQCQGIEPVKISTTDNWQLIASFLHSWPMTRPRCYFSLENEAAFRQIEADQADIIWLRPETNLNLLKDLKIALRKMYPGKRFQLRSTGNIRVIRLNAIHTPDQADLERENKILQHFQLLQSA